jgi:hypothetical protein
MRQYAADEAMGLDLSLYVTSLQQSIKVGREERAAGEPVGPAHVHTLSVRHTPRKSPNATPPRRARTAASARAGGAGRAGGRTLDGFAVVDACGVQLPELVQSVNLMGKGFTDCQVDDMSHFVELQVRSRLLALPSDTVHLVAP